MNRIRVSFCYTLPAPYPGCNGNISWDWRIDDIEFPDSGAFSD